MFKKLVAGLAVSVSLVTAHMSQDQKLNAYNIYHMADKYDLGYTMVAIAMQESSLGRYFININHNSTDCGIFMINTKTIANDKWSQSRICESLIEDNQFSTALAIKRIKYFINYYKSKGYSKNVAWRYAIQIYNAGWSKDRGYKYYKKIVKNIKWLRKHKELFQPY